MYLLHESRQLLDRIDLPDKIIFGTSTAWLGPAGPRSTPAVAAPVGVPPRAVAERGPQQRRPRRRPPLQRCPRPQPTVDVAPVRRVEPRLRVGTNPIVTLGKQLRNVIGNLVQSSRAVLRSGSRIQPYHYLRALRPEQLLLSVGHQVARAVGLSRARALVRRRHRLPT